jgi:hypothetical protein
MQIIQIYWSIHCISKFNLPYHIIIALPKSNLGISRCLIKAQSSIIPTTVHKGFPAVPFTGFTVL